MITCSNCSHPLVGPVRFCPHCGAPQIRVMIPEPAAAIPLSSDPVSLPAARPAIVAGVPLGWGESVRPCALAALVAALLMALGLLLLLPWAIISPGLSTAISTGMVWRSSIGKPIIFSDPSTSLVSHTFFYLSNRLRTPGRIGAKTASASFPVKLRNYSVGG